jgi:putative transposase
MDQTHNGRRLKLMPVVDEFTRECHTLEVERSITAEDVIATLSYLFQVHGEPEYIRSDNGPEFIATAVREWLAASGVKTLYIEPGSPWENAYLESFNGKLEDELLGGEIFQTLLEAKVLIEEYRVSYNHERPHSSLGYKTPAEFAATRATQETAGAAANDQPEPSFPHAAAGSCTKVLSSPRVEKLNHPSTLIAAGTENGVLPPILWHYKSELSTKTGQENLGFTWLPDIRAFRKCRRWVRV